MPTRKTPKVVVALALVFPAVITVTAVGVSDGHHDRSHARSGRSASTPSPVPRELARSYRFLTTTSTPRRPRGVVRAKNVPGGEVVVSAGLEAWTIGRERLWMVLGRSQSCIEVDDGGGACGPNSLVARQGVFVMLVPVSGAAPTVFGIAPDGVRITGRAAAVTRSGNAYMVRPTSHHPGRFVVHTARGPTVTTTIPPATGHPR